MTTRECTFSLRCDGCGAEVAFCSPSSLLDQRRRDTAEELGWALVTLSYSVGGVALVVSRDLCPVCTGRLAGGGAPPIFQAEPDGHDSADGVDDVTPAGTFPPTPAGAPVAGILSGDRSASFSPAGATGIGPCVGRQPASFYAPAAGEVDVDVATWRGHVDTAGMTEEPL